MLSFRPNVLQYLSSLPMSDIALILATPSLSPGLVVIGIYTVPREDAMAFPSSATFLIQ